MGLYYLSPWISVLHASDVLSLPYIDRKRTHVDANYINIHNINQISRFTLAYKEENNKVLAIKGICF